MKRRCRGARHDLTAADAPQIEQEGSDMAEVLCVLYNDHPGKRAMSEHLEQR